MLFHTCGTAWQEGVAPRDQPGIEHHHAFVGQLASDGLVVLAGPFLDADNGGMVVTRIATLEPPSGARPRTNRFAPGCSVRVRPWRVVTRGDA